MATREQRIAYYRQAAAKRGIDPDVALRVTTSEGLNSNGIGDGGSSFGDWQLHYGGMNPQMPNAGLGDEFTAKTGLDARNPDTWQQQADFVLDYAAQHGWGAWMGAANTGIGEFEGIQGTPRISGPVEAAGGGAGSDVGAPQLFTPPLITTLTSAPAAAEPAVPQLIVRDRESNPWGELSSGLASSVRAPTNTLGGGSLDGGAQVGSPSAFPSAMPAPSQQPAVGTQTSQLADLFKLPEIGNAVVLNTDAQGLPIRKRQYG